MARSIQTGGKASVESCSGNHGSALTVKNSLDRSPPIGTRLELGPDLVRVRYRRRSGLLATSRFWYACQTYHRSPVATSSIISHDLQRTEHVAWAKLETLVMGEDNP